MSEPLTEADLQFAFDRIISPRLLEMLDTKMGTVDTVRWLKSRMTNYGGTGTSPDGPYSNRGNPEYWAFRFEQEKRGFLLQFVHCVRGGSSTVLREGLMRWNNLANRATIAACEARHETPPITDGLVKEAWKLGLTREDLVYGRRLNLKEEKAA
jgi:hypothetical protein